MTKPQKDAAAPTHNPFAQKPLSRDREAWSESKVKMVVDRLEQGEDYYKVAEEMSVSRQGLLVRTATERIRRDLPKPLTRREAEIAALIAQEDEIIWDDEMCESLCQRYEIGDITFAQMAKEMKVRTTTIQNKVNAALKKRIRRKEELEAELEKATKTYRILEAVQRDREKREEARRANDDPAAPPYNPSAKPKSSRKRPWSESYIKTVVDRLQQGEDYDKVAQDLSVTRMCLVMRTGAERRRRGMPQPPGPKAAELAALRDEESKIDWNDEMCEFLCQRYKSGDTFEEIAEEMKVRPTTIQFKIQATQRKRIQRQKDLEADQEKAAKTNRPLEAVRTEREQRYRARNAYEAHRRGRHP